MRILCVAMAALLVYGTSSAQSVSRIIPRWVNSTPQSSNKNLYFVTLHTDASQSLDACRAAVLKELASSVERSDKVSVSESYVDTQQQQYRDGKYTRWGSDKYDLKLSVEGSARPINSRRVDEYMGVDRYSGRNCYYALYAVERFGASADFSQVSVTSKYGIQGLWRSVIIPGWGQFHKRSYIKGGLILGGCAVMVGGIVFTETERKVYAAKCLQTHDANAIRVYQNRRNNFATARNICIGATAALYIYNLVDAIVAPGARYVVQNGEKRKSSRKYAVVPSMSMYGDAQLLASITF